MNQDVAKLLEDQINREFFSAYLYLDISNFYYAKNLNGFGSWFKVQAQEEQDHAMLILVYMQNNGEEPRLKAVGAPDQHFDDLKIPLSAALKHEQYITALINRIYETAVRANDFRTTQFLDWFIKEQGEEEKSADDLVKRFHLFGEDPKGLYLLDTELAGRVYAPPSLVL